MRTLSEHGVESQKNASYGQGGFTRDNIWFNWGKSDEHTIRLVGDYVTLHTHWIGESMFGKEQDIAILNASAFKGDDKIPAQVACGNWDVETETLSGEDNCPVCRLMTNADLMLRKHAKDLSPEDTENLKKIRAKCRPKDSYLFKIIDRDNPYVDDQKSKKGYKIFRITNDLRALIVDLGATFEKKGVFINSPDTGIDIVVKRIKKVGKPGYTYSVTQAMDGLSVKQTPLTAEELQFRDLNLTLFGGKPVSREKFEAELADANNVRTVYEWDPNSDSDDGATEEAPF